MPVICLNSSPGDVRRGPVAGGGIAEAPGLALASAISSVTFFAWTFGLTMSTPCASADLRDRREIFDGVVGDLAHPRVDAVRSDIAEQDRVAVRRCLRDGLGCDRAVAPGLLSTITGRFRRSFSFCATMRAIASLPPAGAVGTTIRIGFRGRVGLGIAGDARSVPPAATRAARMNDLNDVTSSFPSLE